MCNAQLCLVGRFACHFCFVYQLRFQNEGLTRNAGHTDNKLTSNASSFVDGVAQQTAAGLGAHNCSVQSHHHTAAFVYQATNGLTYSDRYFVLLAPG